MDRVGEIVSRVERRRRWASEQKVKILTEALQPQGKRRHSTTLRSALGS
jgi:hypothetical protein